MSYSDPEWYDFSLQRVESVHVNVYMRDQEFGGHEEGGWWFTTHRPLPELSNVVDWKFAQSVFEVKQKMCAEFNEGRRPITSVLSEGEYVVMQEAGPPTYKPEFRPHYE